MPEKNVIPEDEVYAQFLELARGASLALLNAQELFCEASLLQGNGAYSRALFLHQISLEECGKAEMLGVSATSLLMGNAVDFKKLVAAFTRHKAKNYTNAYMLPATEEEVSARASGDWKRSVDVFTQQQAKFHQDSNSAKNASLYVDFENEKFSTPKEKITEKMVADISRLNSELLAFTSPKVTMLSSWQSNLQGVRGRLTWLAIRLKELKSQSPNNPEEMLSNLMQEMRDRVK